MSSIAERGRAAMQWMLVVGLISLWASIDNAPKVVETARVLFENLLSGAQLYGIPGDPLDGLPEQSQSSLAQFRHEFLHPGLLYDRGLLPDKRQAMRTIPIDAVLTFSRQTLDGINGRNQPALARSLIDGHQANLAKLEAWRQKSGLGAMATVGDVQDELASRIQVPGTDQTIPLDRCMSLLGLAIVAMQLYLTSLLMTLCEAGSRESASIDRSWVILHRAPLGPFLGTLAIAAPTLVWLWQQVVMPLGETGIAPGASAILIAIAALLATGMSLFETWRVRRQFLGPHLNIELKSTPIETAAESAKRRAA